MSGLAAGADAAGGAAIYVYGQLGLDAVVSGQPMPAGTFLLRYDADGALRWARSVPCDPGFLEALVLDPARGPVIVGNGGGDLTSDDPVPGSGTLVAGFDPDGNVRFARKLASARPALFHSLAIVPSGDIYVASTTLDTETVIEGHVIPVPGFVDYPYLLRLTADGHYVASHVISGDQLGVSASVTTDAEGAAYLHFDCGHANVQPEIDCGPPRGSVIASYNPDGEYRWATSVKSGAVDSIAAAPGNRLIVVGVTYSNQLDLGGVKMASQQLFIAALAGGAARPPSLVPPVPTISGAILDGVSDGQIRQGDTGKLRIPAPVAINGLLVIGGSLVMSDTQIHGWVQGIIARPVFTFDGATKNPLQRANRIDELTSTVNLALDHVDIAASADGIGYEAGESGQFSLRHSHVSGVIVLSDTFTADLGTAADPGANQLESASGVALFDGRPLAGAAIDAHGTTLNGNVQEGDVLGPVQTADYQLQGPNTIRF